MEFDEKEMYWSVVERSREINMEWVDPIIKRIFREDELDPANEPDSSGSQPPDAALDNPQADIQPDPAPDVPGEIIPWEQQAQRTCQTLLRLPHLPQPHVSAIDLAGSQNGLRL